MSIGLATKGILQYFMSKYIPSDEIIMEVIDETIDGEIEDEITGEVRECDR